MGDEKDEKIIFENDNKTIKNPKHIQKNVFVLYSSRQLKIDPANCRKIDTEVTAFLSPKSKWFVKSRFRSDKIIEIFHGRHSIKILFQLKFQLQFSSFRFFCSLTKKLKISRYTIEKDEKGKEKLFIKEKKRQTGGFLNRYDLAYASRDVVN